MYDIESIIKVLKKIIYLLKDDSANAAAKAKQMNWSRAAFHHYHKVKLIP